MKGGRESFMIESYRRMREAWSQPLVRADPSWLNQVPRARRARPERATRARAFATLHTRMTSIGRCGRKADLQVTSCALREPTRASESHYGPPRGACMMASGYLRRARDLTDASANAQTATRRRCPEIRVQKFGGAALAVRTRRAPAPLREEGRRILRRGSWESTRD